MSCVHVLLFFFHIIIHTNDHILLTHGLHDPHATHINLPILTSLKTVDMYLFKFLQIYVVSGLKSSTKSSFLKMFNGSYFFIICGNGLSLCEQLIIFIIILCALTIPASHNMYVIYIIVRVKKKQLYLLFGV